MDRSTLLKALVSSEKNRSMVTIKTVHANQPITGLVEKVLNHIIILKSSASSPVTLTFADIESISDSNESHFDRLFQNVLKTLHKKMPFS